MKKTVNLLLVFISLLLLSACSPKMRFAPGEIPPPLVPAKELKQDAEKYVAAHIEEGNFRKVTSGPKYLRVKNMVERMSKSAGYPPNTFPTHVVDAGDFVNAAAFNGSSIVVYTGLLDKVPSDDELAAVVGHEIGHIMAEHYKDAAEEKQRAAAVGVGASILGTIVDVATTAAGYGSVAGIAGSVAESGGGALAYGAFVGSFSRTQEYEADHIGIILMAKAGYDPHGAIRFWQRAAEVFGSSNSSVGAFFSTHPASSDRMKSLEEALPIALSHAGK